MGAKIAVGNVQRMRCVVVYHIISYHRSYVARKGEKANCLVRLMNILPPNELWSRPPPAKLLRLPHSASHRIGETLSIYYR